MNPNQFTLRKFHIVDIEGKEGQLDGEEHQRTSEVKSPSQVIDVHAVHMPAQRLTMLNFRAY
jgi:hypothetical protein